MAVAQPASQPKPTPSPASASAEMPYAVETFEYPGAAKIQKEQGITLSTGDGHIVLADCAVTHDITVKSRTGQKDYCFAVTGKKGYLALELKSAYGMWTQDFAVTAKVTADGKDTYVNAPRNDYTPFGEAGDTGQSSVLVELRVTG